MNLGPFFLRAVYHERHADQSPAVIADAFDTGPSA